MHLQVGIGIDGKIAHFDTLTEPHFDVAGTEVEASCREHQCKGGEVLVVVAHHQGFGSRTAIDVGKCVQVTDGGGSGNLLKRGDGLQGRHWKQAVVCCADAVCDFDNLVLQHVFGKRLVGIAARFAKYE